jgi:hypothetical protein
MMTGTPAAIACWVPPKPPLVMSTLALGSSTSNGMNSATCALTGTDSPLVWIAWLSATG